MTGKELKAFVAAGRKIGARFVESTGDALVAHDGIDGIRLYLPGIKVDPLVFSFKEFAESVKPHAAGDVISPLDVEGQTLYMYGDQIDSSVTGTRTDAGRFRTPDVAGGALIPNLTDVAIVASTDYTRPELTYVNVTSSRIEATDSYRLHIEYAKSDLPDPVRVPGRVARLMKAPGRLADTDGGHALEVGGMIAEWDTPDVRFPNYASLIPEGDPEIVLDFDAKQVAQGARHKGNLLLQPGGAGTIEGVALPHLFRPKKGDANGKYGANPKYLHEAIAFTGGTVTEQAGPIRPFKVTHEGRLALLMPTRAESEL